MKIRFAVAPTAGASDLAAFRDEITAIEALGFDTVWLSDVPLTPTIDPLIGLSFAAAVTTGLKLGANVVPIGRNPLALAKALAQIDRLSGGRLLLSFVVGIDQPGERAALGAGAGVHRGKQVEAVIPILRRWWAGETVDAEWGGYRFEQVPSPGRSVQQPLEVWLGGRGPEATERIGRVADGWLGSGLKPGEAGNVVEAIQAAARGAGRQVDPEHFGLSIPYAPKEPDPRTIALLERRQPAADVAALIPVGPAALRQLVEEHVAAGLSKFVIRAVGPGSDAPHSLEELATVLLPLQT
jgi:probable F420-dependent oxidoreductase